MKLLLVRHGRTFAPGATPVWVGAHEDPPLTAAGAEEARQLGRSLRPAAALLRRVDVSPMARTRQHVRVLLEAAAVQREPRPVQALRELHYGRWAGCTRAEIEAAGGAQALRAWESTGAYPQDAGFAPPRDEQLAALATWLHEAQAALKNHPDTWALAVTHGGILRLLAELLRSVVPGSALKLGKVACGHGCLVDLSMAPLGAVAWNVPPTDETTWQTLCSHADGPNLTSHA